MLTYLADSNHVHVGDSTEHGAGTCIIIDVLRIGVPTAGDRVKISPAAGVMICHHGCVKVTQHADHKILNCPSAIVPKHILYINNDAYSSRDLSTLYLVQSETLE